MHYEYPIEQLAQSARTRFQMGFARMTMHLMPRLEDVVLEPCVQGLKILGASEMALTMPGEIIRQIHADDVKLREPRVRLLYDTAVREPIMWVRASVRNEYAETVVQDLVARDAHIEEADWGHPQTVVRAQAPLRNLLGYPQALANLSNNIADLSMWLSHYDAMPPGPDDDAAQQALPYGSLCDMLTYPVLESCRDAAFFVTGVAKREIMERLFDGASDLPAPRLRLVGRLHLFVDRIAASAHAS